MDRRIAYVIIALVAALLFFVAVGYSGWNCGGSALSERCSRFVLFRTTGALLLTAGLLILIGGVFLILVITLGSNWTEIVSTVVAVIAAILSIAGVFYYLDSLNLWSPFIATIAMSLTTALAAILLFDLITSYT